MDLSGNLFKTFDVSLLSISIREFYINDCSYLESIRQSQNSLLKDNLKTFSAKSNGNLNDFCPWILWSAPNLQKLDLTSNSDLLLSHRIFKSNENLRNVEIDSVLCDCSPPPDIVEHCEYNGTNLHLSTFRFVVCQCNII